MRETFQVSLAFIATKRLDTRSNCDGLILPGQDLFDHGENLTRRTLLSGDGFLGLVILVEAQPGLDALGGDRDDLDPDLLVLVDDFGQLQDLLEAGLVTLGDLDP